MENQHLCKIKATNPSFGLAGTLRLQQLLSHSRHVEQHNSSKTLWRLAVHQVGERKIPEGLHYIELPNQVISRPTMHGLREEVEEVHILTNTVLT